MAENQVVKKYGKKPFLYALIAAILIALIGLLQWADTNQADVYYYFAQALVFMAGIGHIYLLYRFLPISPGDFWKGFLVTVLIMLASAVAAAVLFYFLR